MSLPWTKWRWPVPVIVAEALRPAPDPALLGRHTLPDRPAAEVRAAIVRALAPPLAPEPPPPWLRPEQQAPFRRAVAAVRAHRGAMLALPVGTGKTWVALAVAAALEGRAACVVPAVLVPQWRRVADRIGIAATITSHEAWSRGPRALGAGVVIVDESHRFRNPALRRTGHLAAALVGRRGLLLTATPVVNRVADLISQLNLLVRDDALLPFGLPSLHALGGSGSGELPAALAHLVMADVVQHDLRPALVEQTIPSATSGHALAVLRRLDALRLSHSPAIRALLRGAFAWAAASSPRALGVMLHRYRLLLLQARDAAALGQPPARSTLHALLGSALDQTIMWPMLADAQDAADPLPVEDLAPVSRLVRSARNGADPKLDQLRRLLADGAPTVVFASSQATVEYLRDRLGPDPVAWCHGGASGIGRHRMGRTAVLDMFGPVPPRGGPLPGVLVATDVGAEGLDLQRVSRIVHYDLPWTPARLDQRRGRAHRLGSRHGQVQVVRFALGPELEQRIGVLRALRRKAAQTTRLSSRRPWAWRLRLAAAHAEPRQSDSMPPAAGVAHIAPEPDSADARWTGLLGFRLVAGSQVVGALALARDRKGRWHDDAASVVAAVRAAGRARPAAHPAGPAARELLTAAGTEVAAALRTTAGALWGLAGRRGNPAAVRWFRLLARTAARRRDARLLRLADRGLGFAGRGHTTGERDLALSLVGKADPDHLEAALSPVPDSSPYRPPLRAEPTGLLVWHYPVPSPREAGPGAVGPVERAE